MYHHWPGAIQRGLSPQFQWELQGCASGGWQLCSVQWAPIWATKTDGKDSDHVILQSDRNLVIYTKDKVPLWASKTDIQHSDFQDLCLVVTDQGTLEISNRGKPVWNSKNGRLC
ncbi:hypothetical protein NQD34_007714 [Periophthalmus magnuspinnatus]|nr:hypothetical protein NQD34_007714 [Periophthalmus magnuspinnatus]